MFEKKVDICDFLITRKSSYGLYILECEPHVLIANDTYLG